MTRVAEEQIDRLLLVTQKNYSDVLTLRQQIYGAENEPEQSGFTQAGVSFVRTFQDKLRDIFSVKDSGAKGDGVTNDRAIISACDSIVKGALNFPYGDYLVGTNLTIASPVIMWPGAKLRVPTGQTLTINGSFSAGIEQCFVLEGTGTVIFGPNAVEHIRPEWAGAKGDLSVDDSTPVQRTVTMCLSTIDYPIPMRCSGRYRLDSKVDIDRKVDHNPVHYIYTGIFRIIGNGRSAGFYATTAVTMFGSTLTDNVTPQSEGITFENIQFESDYSATVAHVLDGEAFLRVNFDNCRFWKIKCLSSSIYVQSIHFKRCELAGWEGVFFNHPNDSGFDITWEHNKIESGEYLWWGGIFNGCRFINNLCEYITGQPVRMAVSQGVSISGNYFESCCSNSGGAYIETGVPFGFALIGNYFALTDAQIADGNYYAIYWWNGDTTGNYSARGISAGNFCSGKLHDKGDLLTYGDDNGLFIAGDECTDSPYPTSKMSGGLKITAGDFSAPLMGYADNAAAIAAGKVGDDFYRIAGDVAIVV